LVSSRSPSCFFTITMPKFPWDVFSANTLRPMVADILRQRQGNGPALKLDKQESLQLLQKIESDGLNSALRSLSAQSKESKQSTRKRKQEEPPVEEARPSRKRGKQVLESPEPSISAPARMSLRSQKTDAPEPAHSRSLVSSTAISVGRSTRRTQIAPVHTSAPEEARKTRTWRVLEKASEPFLSPSKRQRVPRILSSPQPLIASKRTSRAAGRKKSTSAITTSHGMSTVTRGVGRKTKAKVIGTARPPRLSRAARKSVSSKPASVFDGVELLRAKRLAGGNEATTADEGNPAGGHDGDEDRDAEGDVEADVPQADHQFDASSSEMSNSNKENEAEPSTLTGIADAETPRTDLLDDLLVSEGTPAPQIGVPPVEARDIGLATGSPTPHINVEAMGSEENQVHHPMQPGGSNITANLLTIQTQGARATSVDLNPEYSIQVFSPGSVQHNPDEEQWVPDRFQDGHPAGPTSAGDGLAALD
ncbi:unnamed protein product, partial [Mycena citricolor]